MTRKVTLADVQNLQSLQGTLVEVQRLLEQAKVEAQQKAEARYDRRLRSLNDDEVIARLREQAQSEGIHLAEAANRFLGTPPQPLSPSTSRLDLETDATTADADAADVMAAERELLAHVRATREEGLDGE